MLAINQTTLPLVTKVAGRKGTAFGWNLRMMALGWSVRFTLQKRTTSFGIH